MNDPQSIKLRWIGATEQRAAEKAALCLLVAHPDRNEIAPQMTALGLGEASFITPAARIVFSAITQALAAKRALTTDLIYSAMAKEDSSAVDYLLDLLSMECPTAEFADCLVAHLSDLAAQRRIKRIQSAIDEVTSSTEETWEEKKAKLCEMNHELAEITKPAIEKREDPFALIREEFAARDAGEKPKNSKPIYTGMPALDAKFRPIDIATSDHYVIIFGVSGNGKSSLGHQMFANSLRLGYRCAAFLGEVTADSMIKAMASQSAKLDLLNYETELKPKQDKFRRALAGIESLWQDRMFIFDENFVVEEIIRRCRKIAKEVGKLDMVLIDHLHQLKSMQHFKDERLRYNYMSGLMKPLSMELKCPVIVLAQPNRMLKTEARPPVKSDLKETGSLEDDADRIWGIHIPKTNKDGVEQIESLEPEGVIYQLKFKKGRETSAPVKFRKQCTLFEDYQIIQFNEERPKNGRYND